MKVTAILASHNRRPLTLACLEALFAQRLEEGIELDAVLVDDGSSDGTATAVRERFPAVHVIEGDGTLYWATAMALAEATAKEGEPDFLLWVNDDSRLDPEAVSRLLDVHRRRRAVVVGALADPETGRLTYSGVRRRGRHPLRVELVEPADAPREVEMMNGNLVLVERELAEAIGPIDGAYLQGAADFDFALRARRKGITVLLAPGLLGTCTRDPRPSPWLDRDRPLRERLRALTGPKGTPPRSTARYLRRHGGPAWPLYWLAPYVKAAARMIRGAGGADDGAHRPTSSARSAPVVLFVFEWLPEYRREPVQALREALRERGIEMRVAQGDPPSSIAARGDARALGQEHRPNRYLRVGSRNLVWQPWRGEAEAADLTIVNEGSRLLLNYWLVLRQAQGGVRVAFWGHGANLDRANASPIAEAIKRRLYRLPHWWFAYTDGSRDRVMATGFPEDRITVTQNAGPTEEVATAVAAVTDAEVAGLRAELDLGDGPIALYLGSLYKAKRLDFLVRAADEIARRQPDFRLLVGGDGPDRAGVEAAARSRPHLRVLGRLDGPRHAIALRTAKLLLLPGAVGLSVLDGFAAALPTVTVAEAAHGPEIEYLRDGVNGVLLPPSSSARSYGEAVVALLDDAPRLKRLSEAAAQTARTHTSAEMVVRFADGVEKALAAGERELWRRR